MLILCDSLIKSTELDKLKKEFSDLVSQHAGITPVFYTHNEDYTNVPTETDQDGDLKPTKAYVTGLMKKVTAVYGRYGVDSVAMLVHHSNWVFDGIWGTNWSYTYAQDHIHLCRFDSKLANSLGTLYHEWMHSLDALIKTHTGVEIDDYFKQSKCFVDFDTTCVHGNKYKGCKDTPYSYISWKDNTDALAMIAPDLRKAYKVRKELYLEPYKNVQLKVISFLRSYLNRKNGVKK